ARALRLSGPIADAPDCSLKLRASPTASGRQGAGDTALAGKSLDRGSPRSDAMNDTSTRSVFSTVNPATLSPGKSYPGHSPQEAARKVAQSADAQRRWRRTLFAERARLMTSAAAVLR